MLGFVALGSFSLMATFPSNTILPAENHDNKELGICAQFYALEADNPCSAQMVPTTQAIDEDGDTFLERLRVRREYDKNRRIQELVCRFETIFGWTANAPRDSNGPRMHPKNFHVIWTSVEPIEILQEKTFGEQQAGAVNMGYIPRTTGEPGPGPEETKDEEEKNKEEDTDE